MGCFHARMVSEMARILTEGAHDRVEPGHGLQRECDTAGGHWNQRGKVIQVVGRNRSDVTTEGWRAAPYSKRAGVSSPAAG